VHEGGHDYARDYAADSLASSAVAEMMQMRAVDVEARKLDESGRRHRLCLCWILKHHFGMCLRSAGC
jgi:hypothetical protein